MSSKNALTGGTKDVNPQWFHMTGATNGTTVTNAAYSLPVQRLQNKGRSMVMEILKLRYRWDGSHNDGHVSLAVMTQQQPSTAITGNEGYCVDMAKYNNVDSATNANPTSIEIIHDVTDGAGHGVLVATDKLYFALYGSSANVGAANAYVSILYRWKNVSLTEYIGIVQSTTL